MINAPATHCYLHTHRSSAMDVEDVNGEAERLIGVFGLLISAFHFFQQLHILIVVDAKFGHCCSLAPRPLQME
jgi:hypothetical protein